MVKSPSLSNKTINKVLKEEETKNQLGSFSIESSPTPNIKCLEYAFENEYMCCVYEERSHINDVLPTIPIIL